MTFYAIFHKVFPIISDQTNPILGTIRELLKYCESELKNITSCVECYENKHTKPDWRSLPCSKPHLILWVKLDNEVVTPDSLLKGDISYWPVKLLSVDDSAANVIFFGHSELVVIPTKNCFIYSTDRDFDDALQVRPVVCFTQNFNENI